jgi:hypothetical protein
MLSQGSPSLRPRNLPSKPQPRRRKRKNPTNKIDRIAITARHSDVNESLASEDDEEADLLEAVEPIRRLPQAAERRRKIWPHSGLPVDEETLLQSTYQPSCDGEFGENEVALNNFLKRHPMLSLQALAPSSLQLITNAASNAPIRVKELESVSRGHDDLFLRPPKLEIGERPCACGEQCLAIFIAQLRYGPNNDKGFICTEHLLPSELTAFKEGHGLPKIPNKCLLCLRYFQTYVALLARTDPTFAAATKSLSTEAYVNCVVPRDVETEETSNLNSSMAPRFVSECSGDDYPLSSLIFADEEALRNPCIRGSKDLMAWQLRPQVRFQASHFTYHMDEAGKPFITQEFLTDATTSPFGQPPL